MWQRKRSMLRQGVAFAVASAAYGPPGSAVDIVCGHADRSGPKRHIHRAGMKPAGSVGSAVESSAGVAIAAFKIWGQRVVKKAGPDDAATIVLAATIFGCRQAARLATRGSHRIDIG